MVRCLVWRFWLGRSGGVVWRGGVTGTCVICLLVGIVWVGRVVVGGGRLCRGLNRGDCSGMFPVACLRGVLSGSAGGSLAIILSEFGRL